MRFFSLFSGIEAASVAWLPLGWECVGVAEIEPFPCAVLKHYYSSIINLGDVTKITEEQIKALGHIDLVIGGFPCQDLSLAGKRMGLKNADGTRTRSGLFFDAMRIAGWSNARYLLIENVPGLFSSNKGKDFAAVVGEMGGCKFDSPIDQWENTGCAIGPLGLVEWCVLDAQWFGVPQRRRRVFALRDSGNWYNRPPILFDTESLQGHPSPSRKKGKGAAADIAPSLTSSGRGVERTGESRGQDPVIAVHGTQDPCVSDIAFAQGRNSGGENVVMVPDVPEITCPITGNAYGDNASRESLLIPDVAWALQERDAKGPDSSTKEGHLIPIAIRTAQASSNGCGINEDGVAYTLDGAGGGQAVADTPTMAFKPGQSASAHSLGIEEDVAPTIEAGGGGNNKSAVMTNFQVRRLSPKEAARLQGFPDDYLDIEYRGKPACDGPKYKALGNSMCVNVMRWIGERINLMETIFPKKVEN